MQLVSDTAPGEARAGRSGKSRLLRLPSTVIVRKRAPTHVVLLREPHYRHRTGPSGARPVLPAGQPEGNSPLARRGSDRTVGELGSTGQFGISSPHGGGDRRRREDGPRQRAGRATRDRG